MNLKPLEFTRTLIIRIPETDIEDLKYKDESDLKDRHYIMDIPGYNNSLYQINVMLNPVDAILTIKINFRDDEVYSFFIQNNLEPIFVKKALEVMGGEINDLPRVDGRS